MKKLKIVIFLFILTLLIFLTVRFLTNEKFDVSKCQKEFDLQSKINCYQDFMKAYNNDFSKCDKIKETYFKYLCYSTNKLQCDKLNNKASKNDCYVGISIYSRTESFCERVDNSTLQEECYLDSADQKSNESLCPLAGSKTYQCYRLVALNKKDPAICDKIKDNRKYECYLDVSIAKNDTQYCINISNLAVKNNCLFTLASLNKDQSICSYMQVIDDQRDLCYRSVAINALNLSICNHISKSTKTPQDQEECRKAVISWINLLESMKTNKDI